MRCRVLCRSVATLPPRYFATVAPREGTGDAEFVQAAAKFFRALSRRLHDLEFCKVVEWLSGRPHVHALVRAECVSRRRLRRSVGAAKRFARVRASVKPVRFVFACCRYLFKLGRWSFKAEVVPAGFKGKVVSWSLGFLVKPFKKLWREIRAERTAQKGVSP